MKVAVLGCGPTGLVAAHAAALCGGDVTIYSKARKSHMFGAQYLHQPIDGIDAGDPVEIDYKLLGSMDDYRRKVYGAEYVGKVSPADYEGNHWAWDIRRTYDALWKLYNERVEETSVSPGWIVGSLRIDFDLVLSSIPLPLLCVRGHHFSGQDVWAYGDAPERGQLITEDIAPSTVLCNGRDDPTWYRASNIFGYKTLEWSGDSKPLPGSSRVTKPIATDCDCWPNITRVGRFGQWQKGVVVHHAFNAVLAMA